jgi:hypothetical protein
MGGLRAQAIPNPFIDMQSEKDHTGMQVTSEFSEWLRAFADEFPAVADDLLEAIDRYVDSDPAVGDFSLHKHDEIEARIHRLMFVREQLVAAREARDD